MDFNKSILDKINNIVKLTKEFDQDFKIIINLQTNNLNQKNIENVLMLTKNYLSIRENHGHLIIMMNKLVNSSINNINENSEYEKKMYEISTFNSILSNISDLVNNIDFQYKKIALKFPKYINRKQYKLILVTETNDENAECVKLFNEIRSNYPEHIYKILKSNDSDFKKELKKILNEDIKLKLKNLPILYILDNLNLIEIPLEKIKDIESIKQILS